MQSLRNFETLFLGPADTRAAEHEFRGRYVWAESLLNPVPRMFAARRNPQKTVLSRERRACQNAQQSLKNATGTDFENAGAAPEITKNWCPGASRGVPGRGVPGVPWDRCPAGVPGCPWDRCPVTPQDAPGRPGTPPGRPRNVPGHPRDAPGTPRDAPGTPPGRPRDGGFSEWWRGVFGGLGGLWGLWASLPVRVLGLVVGFASFLGCQPCSYLADPEISTFSGLLHYRPGQGCSQDDAQKTCKAIGFLNNLVNHRKEVP